MARELGPRSRLSIESLFFFSFPFLFFFAFLFLFLFYFFVNVWLALILVASFLSKRNEDMALFRLIPRMHIQIL